METIYEVGYGNNKKYYVRGPGDGFHYHSGVLWPEMRFETEEQAKKATDIANKAFNEGYKKAQRDIKKSLGIL